MNLPFWPNPRGYRDIELGLTRVYDLLARLDNPHKKLPLTIHIAGTNGKGSTLSFLRAIFAEAGYLVHCYTSPHLVSFNERIVLAGTEITDEFLNKCLQSCKDAALQHPQIDVTFFEGITVAAFLAFSQVKSDILLLETGLGGRLDATNVITKNLLSIITPIAFDHTDFLGNTLSKIAFEKAGIIKKNCPVIIGKQKVEALQIIEQQATKLGCEIKIFDKNFAVQKNRSKKNWIYKIFIEPNHVQEISTNKAPIKPKPIFCGSETNILFPLPSLLGQHQIDNAATAITAVLTQKKLPVTTEQIASALQKTTWPARLQKITSGKFIRFLPKNFELILDGSHNLQGASTVEKFLKSHKNKKKFVIFSMLQDKDCASFLNKIKNEIDEIICLTIADESKSRNKNEIAQIAKSLKINSMSANNFEDAFAKILSQKYAGQSLILICGSLYLAGEFLKENHS